MMSLLDWMKRVGAVLAVRSVLPIVIEISGFVLR